MYSYFSKLGSWTVICAFYFFTVFLYYSIYYIKSQINCIKIAKCLVSAHLPQIWNFQTHPLSQQKVISVSFLP